MLTHIISGFESRVEEGRYRLIADGGPSGYWSFERVGTRALMPNANEGSRIAEIETDVMQQFFRCCAETLIGFDSGSLEDAVRHILKVWRLDAGNHAQTRNAYKTVEEHVKTTSLNWPNKLLRKSVLSRLVRFALDRVLSRHG